MVKFSKQFEGQLVPEWKEAFVDYRQLKKEIKKIHLLNDQNTNGKKRRSSLPNAIVSSLRKYTCLERKQREPRVIQVHRKLTESASSTDLYETELLEQFADTDAAVEFFACLDLQLNKVNQFYRTKEKEFLERGESLKKQMEILTELKTALKQRHTKGPPSQDSKEEDSISGTISCDDESIKDAIDAEQGLENLTEEFDKEAIKCSETPKSGELERSMRMKKEDGKVRNLNMLAFVKILKKFDKVTNKQVLPIYLRVVESSYFNSSDKALKLADEVEELFVKNFAEDDKRKAMKYLKPSSEKNRML
ncbi:UNVERIFIED_CONTAM: Phosphate transporter [Sesamum latifolium]|uniref:Phosphate transporter n=1 Tax=Sesamum latifolium TaxID=2727402 RepID=A0AAW2X3T7_9LAMI